MDISVIIVSYNVKEFLQQSLLSLKKTLKNLDSEIIVVDNASVDGSARIVKNEFPEINLIENERNSGFAKACNQGLEIAQGKYLLLLNPDTLLQEDTVPTMIRFFENHPEAGAAGCKILNADGTLQKACRRSFPTPSVAIPKMLGLSRFFPKNKLFGKYNLTYKDPDELTEVDAVSGSFLMLRKEVYKKIGGLDEDYFMYGEDLDFCYRIKDAGWKIYYVPDTQIVHYKGESAKLASFDNLIVFYKAMGIFVNKHFSKGAYFFIDIFLKLGIVMRGFLSLISQAVRKYFIPFIDALAVFSSILATHFLQTTPLPSSQTLISMILFYLLLWLGVGYTVGLYDKRVLSYSRASVAAIIGLIISFLANNVFYDMIYSPKYINYCFLVIALLIPGWRIILLVLQRRKIIPLKSKLMRSLLLRRTILIGSGEETRRIAKKMQTHIEHGFEILGFVDKNYNVDRINGFPFLGSIKNLNEIVRIYKATELIFTTDQFDNEDILNILDQVRKERVEARIVPRNLDFILGKSSVEKIEDIPLIEVDYNIFYFSNQFFKRIFDIIVSFLGGVLFSPFVFLYVFFTGGKLKRQKFITWQEKSFTGFVFKRRNGKKYRKNLHRFPLIWSVFKGDMSMVGSELLTADKRKRKLHYKPGITGLFQVQGNHEPDEVDKQNYEHYYMRNYSLFLDIEILLKALLRI
ncbi:MAG: glycosyltransferase [Candidatus Marinimicrobia bacterium]|nr:glycosyltransferase [Candidatus Neomarinimicrobiota bacterium]